MSRKTSAKSPLIKRQSSSVSSSSKHSSSFFSPIRTAEDNSEQNARSPEQKTSAKPPLIKRQCSCLASTSKASNSSFRPIRTTEENSEQWTVNSNAPSPVPESTYANILMASISGDKKLGDCPCYKPKPRRTQAPHSNKPCVELENVTDYNKWLLSGYIFKNIIGNDFTYRGPFGKNKVTYLDYVASGKPLKCIEQYIQQYVMPTYSNVHTEVNYMAEQTTQFREEAREIIRQCVNASESDAVIFTGTGATAAINKLIAVMNLTSLGDKEVIVFISPYEHHSNILPWRDVTSEKVITIRQLDNGLMDLEDLQVQLEAHANCKNVLIGSFSAASNVTGILTDCDSVACLMHSYGGYAFFDYACAAPYTDINMNPCNFSAYKDAVFISPHKFIGGPQTPGVLVAKRKLFRNTVPHGAGGGTVVFVRRLDHSYTSNIEHREEGGTPGIIESIRAGLVFKLKMAFTPQFILAKEKEMFLLAKDAWFRLPNLLIMGNLNVERLAIFPLLFLNQQTGRFLHHDFMAKMLNDVFGIQVRSGCACAGPYGMNLLGVTEKMGEILEQLITVKEPLGSKTRNVIFKPGYVRLNFPYFMPDNCVRFVLKAIQMSAEKGWVLLPLYSYNRHTSHWQVKGSSNLYRSLNDVTFKTGQFSIKKSAQPLYASLDMEKENGAFQPTQNCLSEADSYDKILKRAERIFAEAATPGVFDVPDTTIDFTFQEDALRWFMLPSEAADIINHRQVRHVDPEDLPFLPISLREKMCTSRHT
ncbi:hypothetical protein BsWGS_27488 [Bradybaena similaris]